MKFDRFGADTGKAALMPDGQHECEITKVKQVVRKTDGSEVTVMTLVACDGDFDPIEKWLDPAEKRDHVAAMQLLAALGLPPDTEVDAGLVGRRVIVTAKGGTNKRTGAAVVYVNGFATAEPAYVQDDANGKAKAAPARTQAAKAHREFTAASESDDSIPF